MSLHLHALSLAALLRTEHRPQILRMRLPSTRDKKRVSPLKVKRNQLETLSSTFAERFWFALNEPEQNDSRAIVIFREGVPAGLCLHWSGPYYSTNIGFYVRRPFRRSGIGRELYEFALSERPILRCSRWSQESINFFEKMGAPKEGWWKRDEAA